MHPWVPPAAPPIHQINDALHVLYNPQGQSLVDVFLFHGLQYGPDTYEDAYWSSWTSLSKEELNNPADIGQADEEKVCWPEKWLGPELKARILSLKYDSSILQTAQAGRLDLHNLGENLITDILDLTQDLQPEVGQRAVVLVGHSLGCQVIKQLLLHAQKLEYDLRRKIENKNLAEGDLHVKKYKKIKAFLDNVKGLFFYSPPFLGSKLAEFVQRIPYGTTSPIFEFLKTLSTDGARLNENFRKWRADSRSLIPACTIVESWATEKWGFNDVVVSEASARNDIEDFYTAAADHFTVIRPISRTSTNYLKLRDFVATAASLHNSCDRKLLV